MAGCGCTTPRAGSRSRLNRGSVVARQAVELERDEDGGAALLELRELVADHAEQGSHLAARLLETWAGALAAFVLVEPVETGAPALAGAGPVAADLAGSAAGDHPGRIGDRGRQVLQERLGPRPGGAVELADGAVAGRLDP